MNAHFGDWLAAKRGERGEPGFVSQAELARRMGVDPTYISQLEAKAKAPRYDTRQRIHAALGSTEDELIALGIVGAKSARPGPLQRIGSPSPLAQLIDEMWERMDDYDRASLINIMEGLADRQRLLERHRTARPNAARSERRRQAE